VIESGTSSAAGPSAPLVRFLFLTLFAVAWLLPPETRGESAAGCAILLFLLPLVLLPDAARIGPAVALAAAVAALVTFPALAPAAAVVPVCTALSALVLGGLAARRRRDLGDGTALPWTVAAVAAAVALYALYQYFFGLEATARELAGIGVPAQDALLARLRAGRPFAAFATPAALGGALAFAIPLTIGLGFEAPRRKRPLVALLAALQVGALAATASGTAVGALALGAFLVLARRGRVRRELVLAVAGGLALLALAIVAARGLDALDPTHADSPWRLRAGNVRVAAAMTAEHPFTGVGPGGYGEAFPKYRRAGDNESRHAHSLPPELLAETGVVAGSVLTLLFFAWFLAPAWRADLAPAGWKAGAAAGLAAFAFQNLADFTVFFPSLLWAAAIVRGALARDESRAPEPRALLPAAATLAVACVACVAIARSGLAWNDVVACREFAAAGGNQDALRLARRAAALAPWDIDARLQAVELELSDLVAAAERSSAAWDRVVADADAAVRLSPVRPAARAVRARARLAARDLPGAYADLCEAERLYPLAPEYRAQLGELAPRLPSAPGAHDGVSR